MERMKYFMVFCICCIIVFSMAVFHTHTVYASDINKDNTEIVDDLNKDSVEETGDLKKDGTVLSTDTKNQNQEGNNNSNIDLEANEILEKNEQKEPESTKENSLEKRKQYKVTFVDEDGKTVLYVDVVNHGEAAVYKGPNPTKKADELFSYVFDSWDKEYSNVTKDLTVKAVYLPVVEIAEPTPPPKYTYVEGEEPLDLTKDPNEKNNAESTDKKTNVDVKEEDTPAEASRLPETGSVSEEKCYVSGGILILLGVSVLLTRSKKSV